MTRRYTIDLTMLREVRAYVTADSEEEAIEKAKDAAREGLAVEMYDYEPEVESVDCDEPEDEYFDGEVMHDAY